MRKILVCNTVKLIIFSSSYDLGEGVPDLCRKLEAVRTL